MIRRYSNIYADSLLQLPYIGDFSTTHKSNYITETIPKVNI